MLYSDPSLTRLPFGGSDTSVFLPYFMQAFNLILRSLIHRLSCRITNFNPH